MGDAANCVRLGGFREDGSLAGTTSSGSLLTAPLHGVLSSARMDDSVEFLVPIAKRDRPRQIAYGVVLEPRSADEPDLQGDWYDLDDVEKAAHGFLKRVYAGDGFGDVDHDEATRAGVPVESFIAPVDFMLGDDPVAKGSWVLGMWYPDEAIWKRIEEGQFSAFSVAGSGLRGE